MGERSLSYKVYIISIAFLHAKEVDYQITLVRCDQYFGYWFQIVSATLSDELFVTL